VQKAQRPRASRVFAAARGPSTGFLAALAAVLLAAVSCGGGEESSGGAPSTGPVAMATPGSAAVATEKAADQALGNVPPEAQGPTGAGGAPAAPVGMKHPQLTNDDFLDAPEHRDPFAPFEQPKVTPVATSPTQPLPVQPLPEPEEVAFANTELGDLQCRMVLAMAGEKPRAYLLGPEQENAYVTQGEYVGRSIRAGANEPEVHWRVYEIQEGGVSFELSNSTGQEGDTGVRPALRLYDDQEMRRFENLFSLR
jgi:hypothetical protein